MYHFIATSSASFKIHPAYVHCIVNKSLHISTPYTTGDNDVPPPPADTGDTATTDTTAADTTDTTAET